MPAKISFSVLTAQKKAPMGTVGFKADKISLFLHKDHRKATKKIMKKSCILESSQNAVYCALIPFPYFIFIYT